ncbi:hypothetical protein ACVW0Y_002812 [Pseudomonas sp. TE3786]
MGPIVGTRLVGHLPICDIGMLTATSPPTIGAGASETELAVSPMDKVSNPLDPTLHLNPESASQAPCVNPNRHFPLRAPRDQP